MRIGIGADGSGYWIHLMEYIHKKGEIQAFLCTEEKLLKEELTKGRAEYLFLQEGFTKEEGFNIPYVYFTLHREKESAIYQFQSVDKVYRQMCSMVRRADVPCESERGCIYAVYSPLGRSGKTSFALAYSLEHSFFYIGLEEYGRRGKDNRGMEEILYHIRNRKENIVESLLSLSEQWRGIRTVASPVFFSDIRMMEGEDFGWFLEQLRLDERIDSVFVDFGTGCLVDFEVLDYFDRVFIPILPGEEEERKLERFYELLSEVSGDIRGRFKKIVVPRMGWNEEGFLERVEYVDGIEYR